MNEELGNLKKLDSKNKKKSFYHIGIQKEDSSLKKFFIILFSYMDSLIIINVLFLIMSLGIITIGPLLFAINELFINLMDNKNNNIIKRFFILFKKNFKLSNIIFGITITALISGLFYLYLFFLTNLGNNQYLIAPFILSIFILFYIVEFSVCYIIFSIKTTLNIKTCITNSLRLGIGSIKYAILSMFSFSLFFLLPFIFLERTFILFIVIEFSLTFLSLLLSCYPLVNKYILLPVFEENKIEEVKLNVTQNNDEIIKDNPVIINDIENQYDYSYSDDEKVI